MPPPRKPGWRGTLRRAALCLQHRGAVAQATQNALARAMAAAGTVSTRMALQAQCHGRWLTFPQACRHGRRLVAGEGLEQQDGQRAELEALRQPRRAVPRQLVHQQLATGRGRPGGSGV